MDRDFHLYGTYEAALIAGYEKKEAKTIAVFAQFVDECTKTNAEKLCKEKNYKGERVYTIQSTLGLKKKYGINPRAFTAEELKEVSEVWVPFHFLPGNKELLQAYSGPKRSGIVSTKKWNYTEREEQKFQLMCLANSALAKQMVEKELLFEEKPTLEAIGLVMHVLADTWAHQYFAGIPAWFINDAYKEVLDGENKEIGFKYLSDRPDLNQHQCTPMEPRYNAVSYLGHGRMGHLPDYGYMVYTYQPMWSDHKITRNNPQIYKEAFEQMVYVLTRTKNKGDSFTESKFTRKLSPQNEERMNQLLNIITQPPQTPKEEKNPIEEKCRRLHDISLVFADEQEQHNIIMDGLEKFFEAAGKHKSLVLEEYKDQLAAAEMP